MKALVVFHDEGCHPLGKYLRKGFKHCFVVAEANGCLVRLDGMDGKPVLDVVCRSDYDLATFYRRAGYTVVETHQRRRPPVGPFMLANCVGLVKAFLCIRAPFVFTPYALYRHLTRFSLGQVLPGKSKANPLKPLTDIFSPPKPEVPKPPPPPPLPPERDDPAIQEAARRQRQEELQRRGRRSTILTGASGAGPSAPLGRPMASSDQLGA